MRKWLVTVFVFLLLYTRLVGLNWGLPYPMHPDERNMADAVIQITLLKPYSPSFWSYGGFQMNLAHLLLSWKHAITLTHTAISFLESIIMLRLISAIFSVIAALYIIKIIKKLIKPNNTILFIAFLLATFSPALIQMAHFGTTESALTCFLIAIFFYSLDIIQSIEKSIRKSTLVIIGFLLGLAIATKVTAVFFSIAPLLALFVKITLPKNKKSFWKINTLLLSTVLLISVSVGITLLFSPHYLLNINDFIHSLTYERALVMGMFDVFYTRQFYKNTPILFQVKNVFPYMLGLPIFITSLCGFFFLSWKKKEYNLFRVVLLAYFIPSAFLYAKWARYMTPIIPLLLIFAVLFIARFYNAKYRILYVLVAFVMIIPGIAYLSIYQTPDVRFTASKWIYQNIENGSRILSETANVIDVPVQTEKNQFVTRYTTTQFDFYGVDENITLQQNLKNQILAADFIFIPSRRVFMNHTCFANDHPPAGGPITNYQKRCEELQKKYPILNDYYEKLFSGELGFKKIAEITSYPKITLFNKTLLEFPDEEAEETWTVFDHPVIRIYKRI